jgi:zinc ribbon protein
VPHAPTASRSSPGADERIHMRFCRACGEGNPDDSVFCEACGTPFHKPPRETPPVPEAAHRTPVFRFMHAKPADEPAVIEAAPETVELLERALREAVSPTPVENHPEQAEVKKPRPPRVRTRPRLSRKMKKAIGVAFLLALFAGVAAGAYFAYTSFLAPMSATEYKARAVQDIDALVVALGAQYQSGKAVTDPQALASNTLVPARAAIASFRSLRPPADFRSVHDRLLAGIVLVERSLAVTESLASAGNDPAAQAAAAQALQAQSDSGSLATLNDFYDAYRELKAAPGGAGLGQ